jgi:hypothetical protein
MRIDAEFAEELRFAEGRYARIATQTVFLDSLPGGRLGFTGFTE